MKYLILLTVFISLSNQAKDINFNRDIRPILSDRCFHCHGPDKHDRKKKLRLDIAEGDDGAYRERRGKFGIVPGNLEKSTVWQRIITDDEDDIMPPLDSHKKALSQEEKELIKQWILEGAKYEKFWAFEKPKLKIPTQSKLNWGNSPLDKYVLETLEKNNLKPSEQATKRTLIRRLSFDLTGLPPSPEEIRAFENKQSPDAYEMLVDKLLAKPAYGEHMTRYWLDLVRAGDTNGLHRDLYRNTYTYRDWIIRAFNNNLPYSDFLKYQLAGDLYKKPTDDQLIASGFNRLHLVMARGTAPPEESYTKNVIDRVTAVSTAFMGLTMQCARCHDHKFDPITQKDFYAMFAFFNNFDGDAETKREVNGLQAPFIILGSDKEKAKFAELQKTYLKAKPKIEKLEKRVRQEKDKAKKKVLQAELNELKKVPKSYGDYLAKFDGAMVMKGREKIRSSYMLNRGEYDQKGEVVERDIPEFFGSIKKDGELTTRMDLANWFLAKDNPLTARVAVNRFWQQFFGVGLVKTSEDFGAQGEPPSHLELLDYLTIQFVESGWDIKKLLKTIVMSETYRQTSIASDEQFKNDPENRLLARSSRYRMAAEMIRDNILVSSNLLNSQMYGKSVKPPQPDGLWAAVSMTNESYKADKGDSIYRRSLYTFWKKIMPPPQMTILNAPSREFCVARRERTNTPLQALLLLNEPEYLKAATNLATIIVSDKTTSDEEKIRAAYERVTCKLADRHEVSLLVELLGKMRKRYTADKKLAHQMLGEVNLLQSQNKIELASWTMLINTLYNLDITKNRE
ncbi:PSD1 and planctomycete cytochrome C domain-containing protein [Lentisphaera marina]|uniref:PSD1 and planctomycete cytochrome C domain-containing protein n=1 Tax=Lentisphaera marina TaxID=1111041 RepID=UPI0023672E7F|nr:PSD1 and planctomycete cytochrome C domain-containing protein [Lentisphaera marina]MDD7985137.1 PSD1 and planctomycete cytochrome C domain-containing protein [Lentisphaera marina]